MSVSAWVWLAVGISCGLYVIVSWVSRARTGKGFYVADVGVSPMANGMSLAVDRFGAASFVSLAGVISMTGYSGSAYIMGWIGGYFLLGVALLPYLRRFPAVTITDFVGERYYSDLARVVALVCLIIISVTYLSAQVRGVGIVLSRVLEIEVGWAVAIAVGVVFVYATFGGMKGITWTQVIQYCVIAAAYLIPAVLISMHVSGHPAPQLGYGGCIISGPDEGKSFLEVMDRLNRDLGFSEYTRGFGAGPSGVFDMALTTLALTLGTMGLPHIVGGFFSIPSARGTRLTAAYALLFMALLYSAAPAAGAFGRYMLITGLENKAYEQAPSWFKAWEKTGLVAWVDKNQDGRIQYTAGAPFDGSLKIANPASQGRPLTLANRLTENKNELYVHPDVMVLANPEMAALPNWITALILTGALTASLSVAAGLLLMVGAGISHEIYSRIINKRATGSQRAFVGRAAMAATLIVAGYLGAGLAATVAQTVAFAFGLAAASFFPVLVLGVFWSRANSQGIIAGMVVGAAFTGFYMVQVGMYGSRPWFLGIGPEGIGVVGMILNFMVASVVSRFTSPPPEEIQELVGSLRYPLEAPRT